MAIEPLWLLIIVIVAAQISLKLITIIVAGEYHWLLILVDEFIDYKGHKFGIGFRFYFNICGCILVGFSSANIPKRIDTCLRPMTCLAELDWKKSMILQKALLPPDS